MSSLPRVDELEVSVFGPGVGESMVIHLGGGEWMIVDSAKRSGSSVPEAMRYLDSIGVDATSVIAILITHWHDDHIRGATQCLRHFRNANFYCSLMLKAEQFCRLAAASQRNLMLEGAATSGVDEFVGVLNVLEESGRSIRFITQSRTIVRTLVQGKPVEVHALSPSDYHTSMAVKALSALEPSVGDAKQRIRSITPNQGCVVLWVDFGGRVILLGADMESDRDPRGGWNGVQACQTRSLGSAEIVKVPHHGSPNADDTVIWDSLVGSGPFAIVTPYTPSRLPSANDVKRLKEKSRVYCTGRSVGRRPARREAAVEKSIDSIVRRRSEVSAGGGWVRLRAQHGGPVRVELFGTAYAA